MYGLFIKHRDNIYLCAVIFLRITIIVVVNYINDKQKSSSRNFQKSSSLPFFQNSKFNDLFIKLSKTKIYSYPGVCFKALLFVNVPESIGHNILSFSADE